MIDIQSGSVTSRFPLEAVGVVGLKYPLTVRDPASGALQGTTADWRLSVTLPADRRGTHMSRFVEELHARVGQPLDLDGCLAFASSLTGVLDAEVVEVTATFPWFREVRAPVSGKAALLEQQVTFSVRTGPEAAKTLVVQVAAKALCPCSKAVAERGAHNQRSDIRASLTFAPNQPVPTITKVCELLEASASSPIYPLLKRADEKFVTEQAYDNPAFVEDIVRAAATRLLEIPGLARFTVEAINRESIHAHDCFARISYPGKP